MSEGKRTIHSTADAMQQVLESSLIENESIELLNGADKSPDQQSVDRAAQRINLYESSMTPEAEKLKSDIAKAVFEEGVEVEVVDEDSNKVDGYGLVFPIIPR